MKTSLHWTAAVATLSLAACASPPPASAPVTPGADPTPTAAASSTGDAPAASAPAVATVPAASRRPLDLENRCPHEVHLYYGEQPGDGKGQVATIATGATVPVPRGNDGAVVVWVTDDKGFGLASVHVTRHMHHVRIDATCSKLEADSARVAPSQ